MKRNFGASDFIQLDLFEANTIFENNPQIAFSALQQIQSLRAKNQKQDASSVLKEWIL